YFHIDWMTDPVTLNVGGCLYTTSQSTLQRYPDSLPGGHVPLGLHPPHTALRYFGHYFIDRDGSLFRYVLNLLRTSELTLPCDITEMDLLRKADFYQIEPLMQSLTDTKPLYPPPPPRTPFEEVVELSSTRKLSKYSNPVAVVTITQLTITTKVHSLLERVCNSVTKWIKHYSSDFHEVSLRVFLLDCISKQGFRNTRVHQMSERANENTVEHRRTFCRLARKVDD
uniref:Potassium channel tetramerization domain containing 6a n=1 Tax=Oncorhynchus mykiss TaxID=8022 RepID=A0A8K9UW07_ONCMY